MNHKILKKSGLFFTGVIIVIFFISSINTQPCVFGTNTTFISSTNHNYYYDLLYLGLCKEFSSFLNNFSRFNYNNIGLLNTPIEKDVYNIGNYNFSNHCKLNDIDISLTNIQNQILNKNDIVKKYGINNIDHSLFISDELLNKISDKLIKINYEI